MTIKHEDFIITYHPSAGWKAVYYWWNPDLKMMEPLNTSPIAFNTKDGAIRYAKQWAIDEGVRYVD